MRSPSRTLSRSLALAALTLGALFLLLRPDPGRADEDNVPDQIVVVGSNTIIDVPYPYGNIAEGNSEKIRVIFMRDSGQLLLSGRREGITNILIYDQRGVVRDEVDVTIVPERLSAVMGKVKEILEDIEGLSIKVLNNKVYIQGEVATDEELQRVNDLARQERMVESTATLSPIAKRLLAGLIETEIDRPQVQARLIGKRIILEGIVHSEAASRRAEAIARAYSQEVDNVLEVREVDRRPGRGKTVVIVVHYVELSKRLTTTWGIEWTPLASAEGVDFFFERDYNQDGWGGITGEASATLTGLFPKLRQARASGYARVLENPTISIKSGEKASIFSGAEYPYLVSQGMVNTVEFKDIGVRLNVTPYAQGNDVDMDIEVIVTALGEVAPNGYQSINKSELNTAEYCRSGESVVLGGLQRISDTRDYNRVPTNEADGALYTFYQNRNYKKSKSQFLVFLTPKIHESSSSANRELKDQFHLEEVRQ